MPIFDAHIKSLDGKSCEEVEFTGSKLADFTTVRRPDMNQMKLKYPHMQDKRFIDKHLARLQNGEEQAIWSDRSGLCQTL